MPPTGAAREPGLGTFVAASVCGLFAALGGFVACVYVGVYDDVLFLASLAHPGAVMLSALVFAVIVGAAAASARTESTAARRGAITCLVLGAGVLGALALRDGPLAPGFDAPAFRAAVRADDTDEVERQAYRAVDEGVLIGRSPAAVRRVLGPPERRVRKGRVWMWDAGMINDFLGPGDGGNLYVGFGPDGRVTRAVVDSSF